MQPYGAQHLTKQSYHQISALPLPVLIGIDDPNSSLPSGTKLKHLATPLMIAVLMREAVRCITVQQMYP
jgi:hypothetical protein